MAPTARVSLSVSHVQDFIHSEGSLGRHGCAYVKGVGDQAFMLSGPSNIVLSVSVLFWVRHKSGLFRDLCPRARFTLLIQRRTLSA